MSMISKSLFAAALVTASFSVNALASDDSGYTLKADCDTQAADATLQQYLGADATIESAIKAVASAYDDAAGNYESDGNGARGYADLGNGYTVKVSYGTDGGPVNTDLFVMTTQGSSAAGKKIQAAIKACVNYPN